MALLTATQIRDHIETSLIDEAIERYRDAAEEEIIAALGPAASHVEVHASKGSIVPLARRATSITSVVERNGDTSETVDSDEYELAPDGYSIRRKEGGSWGEEVTATVVPYTESASRIQAMLELVKLAIAFDGLASSGLGDVRQQGYSDYHAERVKVINTLRSQNRRMHLA